MRQSRLLFLAAAASLVLWIGLAFAAAIPSGWVHVPLVVAVFAIVGAIVAADAERAERG